MQSSKLPEEVTNDFELEVINDFKLFGFDVPNDAKQQGIKHQDIDQIFQKKQKEIEKQLQELSQARNRLHAHVASLATTISEEYLRHLHWRSVSRDQVEYEEGILLDEKRTLYIFYPFSSIRTGCDPYAFSENVQNCSDRRQKLFTNPEKIERFLKHSNDGLRFDRSYRDITALVSTGYIHYGIVYSMYADPRKVLNVFAERNQDELFSLITGFHLLAIRDLKDDWKPLYKTNRNQWNHAQKEKAESVRKSCMEEGFSFDNLKIDSGSISPEGLADYRSRQEESLSTKTKPAPAPAPAPEPELPSKPKSAAAPQLKSTRTPTQPSFWQKIGDLLPSFSSDASRYQGESLSEMFESAREVNESQIKNNFKK